MRWDECKKSGLVKPASKDLGLINSLIFESKKKLKTDSYSPLNEETASTKFVLNYDALREILEALAIQRGFKIYNHECFSSFLKDVLKMEKEAFEFEKIRRIRNAVNYYGQDLTVQDFKELLNIVSELRIKLINILNE